MTLVRRVYHLMVTLIKLQDRKHYRNQTTLPLTLTELSVSVLSDSDRSSGRARKSTAMNQTHS